jgi:hypothetical protein
VVKEQDCFNTYSPELEHCEKPFKYNLHKGVPRLSPAAYLFSLGNTGTEFREKRGNPGTRRNVTRLSTEALRAQGEFHFSNRAAFPERTPYTPLTSQLTNFASRQKVAAKLSYAL